MTDSTVECEYCGAKIARKSWGTCDGRVDGNSLRYLKIHQNRCRHATKEERTYFRERGKWPRRPKKRARG